MASKKLIIVFGATGAQGLHLINKLIEPSDNAPSPYTIRAFTRDPESRRAKLLRRIGVEIFQGTVDDFSTVKRALEGVYGVFVNIDGFTVGEAKDIFYAMRIFELAKQVKTVRHFVYSSLDYTLKKGGYDEQYRCAHYDGKGRVAEWLKAQPSIVSDSEMSWTVLTTGPYMDMLLGPMFGPMSQRRDGTFVFATPVGKGHVPMIALSDVAFFGRYIFDHRALTSGQDLEVASEMVSWDYLIETFTKVTGQKATVKHLPLEQWCHYINNVDRPLAPQQVGTTTWKENFSGWWAVFRDDVLTRDMDWLRSIHPNLMTLERWMKENNYVGQHDFGSVLKLSEDGKNELLNQQATARL